MNPVSTDFETLVGKAATANGSPPTAAVVSDPFAAAPAPIQTASWEDDVWGNLLNDTPQPSNPQTPATNTFASAATLPASSPMASRSAPSTAQASRPGFQPRPSKLGAPSLSNASQPPMSRVSSSYSTASSPAKPNYNISLSTSSPAPSPPSAPILPAPPSFSSPPPLQPSQPSRPSYGSPNYSISLSSTPQAPTGGSTVPPPLFATPMVATPTPPTMGMGMGGGILQPSKPAQPTWGSGSKQLSKADWGDFDPLA